MFNTDEVVLYPQTRSTYSILQKNATVILCSSENWYIVHNFFRIYEWAVLVILVCLSQSWLISLNSSGKACQRRPAAAHEELANWEECIVHKKIDWLKKTQVYLESQFKVAWQGVSCASKIVSKIRLVQIQALDGIHNHKLRSKLADHVSFEAVLVHSRDLSYLVIIVPVRSSAVTFRDLYLFIQLCERDCRPSLGP